MGTPPSPDGRRRPATTGSVEAQFLPLVDQLDLEPLQREFLRRRWLDQVSWLENRAASSQRWYHRLRLTIIVGGVIIPALVGLNVSGEALGADPVDHVRPRPDRRAGRGDRGVLPFQ
jgi:Protein of unknown function (DUF4231)